MALRRVNRILCVLVALVAILGYSLMVFVSLTYAVAAIRMSRRGVLAQQLNAIESLASVDTICVDKTGTLTEAALRLVEIIPAAATDEEAVRMLSLEPSRARPAPTGAVADCVQDGGGVDDVDLGAHIGVGLTEDRQPARKQKLADCVTGSERQGPGIDFAVLAEGQFRLAEGRQRSFRFGVESARCDG
jgi:magnesium-transporting ATPase (P-type)